MEPPYWYYPVRQTLAVVLMQAGRLDEAEEQFKRALKHAPSNGWSWYGLAELYKARGKVEQASRLEADLAKKWIGNREQLKLSKL
jgi:Tfp pilus assembly protein PilF